jgi:hypothetical protein
VFSTTYKKHIYNCVNANEPPPWTCGLACSWGIKLMSRRINLHWLSDWSLSFWGVIEMDPSHPTDLQLKSVTKKFLFVSNIRITPSFQLEFGHWLKKERKRDTTPPTPYPSIYWSLLLSAGYIWFDPNKPFPFFYFFLVATIYFFLVSDLEKN